MVTLPEPGALPGVPAAAAPADVTGPRVLRLASVFPVPDGLLGRDRAYDPVGGMQNHTRHLSAELDRLGVPQTVVTANRPGAPRRQPLGDHGTVLRAGVPARRLRQGFGPAAAAVLARLPGPYDVVHAHLGEDAAVLPLALAAARRWSAPLVVTVHMSVRHTMPVTGPRSVFLRTVGGGLETFAVRRAAAVITLTERLAARMPVAGGRLHVIPSGVPPAAFGTAGPGEGVVFVGRLHPQKGVDTLVRALPLLPPGTRLTLVGDGPQRAAIDRLVAGLGLGDRVRVTGFVPHSAGLAIVAGAAVVVLPSRYEELGTALVEAMAAGRPVVASRVGGIPELVRHGIDGLLVRPGDPAALAGALNEVLTDPALAAALGAAARARVAAYDWRLLAGRVLEVYGSVS